MLPIVPQSLLNVKPIDWAGLPRRFMNPGELEVLIALLRPLAPRHVIEFGVNVGRTARAISWLERSRSALPARLTWISPASEALRR